MQAMKTRSEHIQKYLQTIFLRDYINFTKSGSRHEHSKASTLVSNTLAAKNMELQIKKALELKADEDKKTSIFGRLLG